TPNDPNFSGPDSFIYSVCDDGTPQACDQATVSITIFGINTTDAVLDINNTYVDLPVSGNVLTNDEDLQGDTQTVTTTGTITTAQGGTVEMSANGNYTYTPPAGYSGEDTFDYSIIDDGNPQAVDTTTVYIEILPANDSDNQPPVANPDTASTEVNTPVDGVVIVNDFDPEGDPITVTTTTVTTTEGVTVTIDPNTGEYTYTPPTDFVGVDTFEYTICDNGTPALCDTTTVEITVVGNSQENNTFANDDAYNGMPGENITGNVSDNDSDPEGDTQTVNTVPVVNPMNGTVALQADGSFVYTPNDPTFVGTDQFVYSVCDDGTPQACDEATVYITIGEGINEIYAIDDINDTFVNTPVTGDVSTNDDNLDGPAGSEVFTLVSGPNQGGTLTFNPDGTYTYTPPADFVGEDIFVYEVCDGGNPQACDQATVTIEVVDDPILENDPPIANNDTAVTEVNTPVTGNVLVNDYDLDGDPITVTTTTVTTTEGVVVTIDPITGVYTYTPPTDFTGVDTFVYTICDDADPALCDEATVYITVIDNSGNITVANDDSYYGEINTTISGNVLTNDTDPEGDGQTVTSLTVISLNGVTVTINPDGSFDYTAPADFTGTDQFVYTITDDNAGGAATDQATVYILIEETPDPAIAIVKTSSYDPIVNGECTASEGDIITYTFEVTNEGNVDLMNVSVTDPLLEAPNPVVTIAGPTGDDGDGILQTTETWIYTADYVITQADINAGIVTNQATATGTDEDGTTVTDLSGATIDDDLSTDTEICQVADIAIVKTSEYDGVVNGECTSDVGDTIAYTFTVTNEGNVDLSNVTVTDPLLQAPNPVVTIAGPTGDDGDGILQPTETWVYTADYAITQADINAGMVTNQATATGTPPTGDDVTDLSGATIDDDLSTDTEICNTAAIAIVKTSEYDGIVNGECTSDVGDTIAYTFTVTNEGNVDLSNVTVTDPLLQAPNPVVTIAGPTGDDGDGILQPTETWVYTADYAITQADINAGMVTNQATATGTPPTGDDVTDLSGVTIDDDLSTDT
ncbi:Ig-like domain-containing protein, partial [Jejudonia soesokkakensis]